MNIMYCGDRNVERGLMMSAMSLKNHTNEKLSVFILTAGVEYGGKVYKPIGADFAERVEEMLKSRNPKSSVTLIDAGESFLRELPSANMDTRFTPMCMLRLFADEAREIPDRVLYLDCDVLCLGDFKSFYRTDLSDCEIAGVPDRYGRFLFSHPRLSLNYLNSGVLLMNIKQIRQSGLFRRCRELCRNEKMFMPDQSALNRLAVKKKTPRVYNEQGRIKDETVFKHFTTFFKFFPRVRAVTVKPWDVDGLHNVLHIYEFDELIDEYRKEITNASND